MLDKTSSTEQNTMPVRRDDANVPMTLRSTGQIGHDIRALRQSRGWTLIDLANELDRSIGWLSQVERGTSEPALSDLRKVAMLFNLPLSFFFSNSPEHAESDHVVRAQSRRIMHDDTTGLREELLSPDLGGRFEMLRSVFAAGTMIPAPVTRPTEEAGYIVSGQLTLTLDGQVYELKAGDSFRFAGEAMQWKNEGREDAVVIWVIAPPIY
jgi:transcriptional regulator with XRE-family HTH domain